MRHRDDREAPKKSITDFEKVIIRFLQARHIIVILPLD